MTVFTVIKDNGLNYEDHWSGVIKICSTKERAEQYIKEEEERMRQYYIEHEDEYPMENPSYKIVEEEVL